MEKNSNHKTASLLFICRFNQMRSRTAEEIFSAENFYRVRSAGTDRYARRKITGRLILWADVVFVMEDEQETIIREKFPDQTFSKRIVNLDIPDNYYFMDPELADLIKMRVNSFLEPAGTDTDQAD
jgi:predicted protein tyrosine phosphatase